MRRKVSAMLLGIVAGLLAVSLHNGAGAATIGHWRFEEGAADSAASGSNTVVDSSGNGLHGTPVYGPVYRTDVPGSGLYSNTRSMEFDGISAQRVTVPDGPLSR